MLFLQRAKLTLMPLSIFAGSHATPCTSNIVSTPLVLKEWHDIIVYLFTFQNSTLFMLGIRCEI